MNVMIKKITISEYRNHEGFIRECLEESYKINFNYTEKKAKQISSIKSDDLLKYLENNQAILKGSYVVDKLVGIIWMFERNYLDERRLHINQVVIDKLYQGKGIGKILMKEAEKTATQHNIYIIDLKVTKSNLIATGMYKKLGYTFEKGNSMRKDLRE